MVKFDKIKKLATLYKEAAFLAEGSREDVRGALGYLIDILTPEQMQSIQEFYIDIADSAVPVEERQAQLNNLADLTDSILDSYIEDDRQHEIYKYLDIINTNAEEELDGTAESIFNESIEQAKESVDYQEGEEIAQTGQGSVTEDINKKKERDKEYRSEKRHNPIFREKYLERQREYDRARYSLDLGKLKKNIKQRSQRSIAALIDSGLTKEQAINKFNEDIQSAIVSEVQSQGITKEEAKQSLLEIKSQEIKKYLDNLVSMKREERAAAPPKTTPAERKRRSRLAQAYAEQILVYNPDTNIEDIKSKIKSMSIEDLQTAIQKNVA